MTGQTLVAILGPTASGKSALGIALAERHNGEIVSCDSTAVYRGFDIGTDKVSVEERRRIPHHLVDVADPVEEYSAARYAREAAAVIHAITARGRLPILVGGTGFYYRALSRGLFAGPGRDAAMRARLAAIARRRGPERLHRLLACIDPASADRIQPRDEKRMIRALEVYFLTGRPLTDHFAGTASPLPEYDIAGFVLNPPAAEIAERVARRVDAQFARGIVAEVEGLRRAGIPETALPFTGLVYRQVLEHLHGVRDEQDTRALIVRENKRYARRQLIWFRKEPNLRWIHRLGDDPAALASVEDALASVS
jgi:tRNA dimethylallyltransferase